MVLGFLFFLLFLFSVVLQGISKKREITGALLWRNLGGASLVQLNAAYGSGEKNSPGRFRGHNLYLEIGVLHGVDSKLTYTECVGHEF